MPATGVLLYVVQMISLRYTDGDKDSEFCKEFK